MRRPQDMMGWFCVPCVRANRPCLPQRPSHTHSPPARILPHPPCAGPACGRQRAGHSRPAGPRWQHHLAAPDGPGPVPGSVRQRRRRGAAAAGVRLPGHCDAGGARRRWRPSGGLPICHEPHQGRQVGRRVRAGPPESQQGRGWPGVAAGMAMGARWSPPRTLGPCSCSDAKKEGHASSPLPPLTPFTRCRSQPRIYLCAACRAARTASWRGSTASR